MLDIVLMIAWSILRNRNEVRHEGRKLAVVAIYGLATRLLEEYLQYKKIQSNPKVIQLEVTNGLLPQ